MCETESCQFELWLNSKVDDKYVENIYDMSGIHKWNNRIHNIYNFTKYYQMNDIDMKLNNRKLIGSVNHMRKKFPDKFKSDLNLVTLDRIIEKYREKKETEWKVVKKSDKLKANYSNIPKKVDILIPQGTNRYHTNYLFKQMMDCNSGYKMRYNIPNLDNNDSKYNTVELITPDFKEEFYKFCFNYTH